MKSNFKLLKIKTITLFFGILISLVSCNEKQPSVKEGMIKVTILYPNTDGKTFDMNYYTNRHMPMVADLFGNTLKHYKIDQGISGRTPEDTIPYLAIGYFYFDTLSDYQSVFGPNAKKILDDIPNYTNIQPVVQISKIVR